MADAPWIECKLDTCHNLFQKSVHNQAFCNHECTRIFTNARILAAYHTKKNKVMNGRVCASKTCSTLLSRYNQEDFCSLCLQKQQTKKLEGWGWKVDSEGFRVPA